MRRTILVLVSVIAALLLVVTPVLAAPAPQPANAPLAWGAPGCHMVRPGETLFSIGRRYGVSPWAIASANHLRNPNRIYAGQCLYIPPRCATWYCGCPSYYGCNWGYRW